MKSTSELHPLAACVLALSLSIWLGACRESPGQGDTDQPQSPAAASAEEPSTAAEEPAPEDPGVLQEQISGIQREIDSRKRTIEDLQAAVEMEQAKLQENPDYDQSFLLGVMEEQQELREAIEADETRLEELTRPSE